MLENLSQYFKLQRILESESCRPSPGRQSVRGGAAESFTVFLNLLFNSRIKHFNERLFIASPFSVDDDS
jgi:hypothetical protein